MLNGFTIFEKHGIRASLIYFFESVKLKVQSVDLGLDESVIAC